MLTSVSEHDGDLQRAIDSIRTLGGTVILDQDVPVRKLIQLRSGVRIAGYGHRVIAESPFDGNMVAIGSGDSDLAIDGTRFVNKTDDALSGLFFNANCARVDIDKCKFKGFARGAGVSGIAIDAVDIDDLTVGGGTFFRCDGGVRVRGVMRGIAIDRNGFLFSGRECVMVNPTVDATGIRIADNVARNMVNDDAAFYLTCGGKCIADHVLITGNRAEGKYEPFAAGGNADLITAKNVRDFVVAGNIARGGGDCGLSIVDGRRGSVAGNVAAANTTVGLCLWTCRDVAMTGNTCMNNKQGTWEPDGGLSQGGKYGGIRLERDTIHCVVSGNRCGDDQDEPTQDYGIVQYMGAHANTIGDNDVRGNRIAGYYPD